MGITIIKTKEEMTAWSRAHKKAGRTVAFVPTMGYLHDGHLSLVKAGRDMADVVVSSIYVNPTQFSANEDFDVYPRQPEVDRAKLESAGCAAVFEPDTLYAPSASSAGDASNVVGRQAAGGDVDPDAHETYVTVERLQLPLCGASRPHHFRGVATVVTKLFNIVQPDVALFGRKDYQQWRLLQRMVRDLDVPVKVVGMPICREADGLAMSSRNARLSPQARQDALCIQASLKWAHEALSRGEATLPEQFASHISERVAAAGGKVDYVQLVHAVNLAAVADVRAQPTLLAIAAHFPARDRGTVRLIDNTVLNEAPDSS